MATQKDKDREQSPRTTGTPAQTSERSTTKRTNTNDPDTYNPVGMAGEKAGKVEQIEDQLRNEGGTRDKGKPAGSREEKGSSKA